MGCGMLDGPSQHIPPLPDVPVRDIEKMLGMAGIGGTELISRKVADPLDIALLKAENRRLREAVRPIMEYKADDTAGLDDYMAACHVMNIINKVQTELLPLFNKEE